MICGYFLHILNKNKLNVSLYLSQSALDFVVEENMRAKISCWYIKKYITENPMSEYKDNIIN